MLLLFVLILIVAAAAGVLWQVLEIALAIVLAVFLAGLLLVAAGYWFIRRRLGAPRQR